MEKRRIGSLEVSVVGLGCNNFGWRIETGPNAAVVAALDAGITFVDTAGIYGRAGAFGCQLGSDTCVNSTFRLKRGQVCGSHESAAGRRQV